MKVLNLNGEEVEAQPIQTTQSNSPTTIIPDDVFFHVSVEAERYQRESEKMLEDLARLKTENISEENAFDPWKGHLNFKPWKKNASNVPSANISPTPIAEGSPKKSAQTLTYEVRIIDPQPTNWNKLDPDYHGNIEAAKRLADMIIGRKDVTSYNMLEPDSAGHLELYQLANLSVLSVKIDNTFVSFTPMNLAIFMQNIAAVKRLLPPQPTRFEIFVIYQAAITYNSKSVAMMLLTEWGAGDNRGHLLHAMVSLQASAHLANALDMNIDPFYLTSDLHHVFQKTTLGLIATSVYSHVLDQQYSLLDIALKNQNKSCAEVLVRHPNTNLKFFLTHAIGRGHVETVRYILETREVDIFQKIYQNMTALEWALATKNAKPLFAYKKNEIEIFNLVSAAVNAVTKTTAMPTPEMQQVYKLKEAKGIPLELSENTLGTSKVTGFSQAHATLAKPSSAQPQHTSQARLTLKDAPFVPQEIPKKTNPTKGRAVAYQLGLS